MARPKFSVPRQPDSGVVPFSTAEEAWLWYAHCQTARDEGARFTAGLGDVPRPCEPDDIARELRRLQIQRKLRPSHLAALHHAGDGSRHYAKLWDEAMDRLTTPLRLKGIVA